MGRNGHALCVCYWVHPPFPSVSSLGEMSTGTSPSPDGTGADQHGKFYIFPTDGHQVVEQTPRSAPPRLPPFALAEPHKPFKRLTNSMPNLPTRAVGPVQASSSKFSSDALSRSSINLTTRSTHKSVEYDAVSGSILTVHKVSEANRPESFSPVEGRDTRDDGTGSAWDLPFIGRQDQSHRMKWACLGRFGAYWYGVAWHSVVDGNHHQYALTSHGFDTRRYMYYW